MTPLELAKATTNIAISATISDAQWTAAELEANTDFAVMIKRLGMDLYSSDPLCDSVKAKLIKRQISKICLEFSPEKTLKGRSHFDPSADGINLADVIKYQETLYTEAENIVKTLKPVYSDSKFFNIKAKT